MASDRVIEMPPEWGGIVPTQVFLDEGRRIVDEAAIGQKIPAALEQARQQQSQAKEEAALGQ